MLNPRIRIQNHSVDYHVFMVRIAIACKIKKQHKKLHMNQINLKILLLFEENIGAYFLISRNNKHTQMLYTYPKITIPIESSRIDIPQFRSL